MGRRFNPPKQNRPRGISRRKFLGQAVGAAALSMASSHRVVAALDQGAGAAPLLQVDTRKPVNSFDPDKSLGSSMDELSIEVIQKIYTPEMVRQWLAAGWGPITYRNHTELAIEAWHWNSKGTWSPLSSFTIHSHTRCRIAARRQTEALPTALAV
jgi:hypothetical protein